MARFFHLPVHPFSLAGTFFGLLLPSLAVAQASPQIDATITAGGDLKIIYPADSDRYYVLRRGASFESILNARDVALGDGLTVELGDALSGLSDAVLFQIETVPRLSPLDLDEDGVDDVFELERSPLLDPLRKDDAALDPDEDGRSTREEYDEGTDPLVTNPPKAPVAPTFLQPASATGATAIMLDGTAPIGSIVRVEGGASLVEIEAESDGSFMTSVPLAMNRLNRLFVTAVNETGTASRAQSVEVLQDSQAPTLFIDFPNPAMPASIATTQVAGRVGDGLSGFKGLRVWIHSSPSEGDVPATTATFPDDSPLRAEVDVGIGPNGTYERADVPLAEGTNTLTVIAADQLGNRVVKRLDFDYTVPVGPRLVHVSGDRQSGTTSEALDGSIVLRVEGADGTPIADTPLLCEITRSNGRVRPLDENQLLADWRNDASATDGGAARLRMKTDLDGEVHLQWTLGRDAGSGNNRLCVTGDAVDNAIFFTASAAGHPAQQINLSSGDRQRLETGTRAAEPLRVWLSDGLNPAAGVDVSFAVIRGDATLLPGAAASNTGLAHRSGLEPRSAGPGPRTGEPTLTVTTSTTGHAGVDLVAGTKGGTIVVEADFEGNPGLPIRFSLEALARRAGPGTFTGLVLDNSNQPIEGADCELMVGETTLGTASDAQGRFFFDNVPGGMGHLHVDGRTATHVGGEAIPPETFPPLSYSIVTVANADNSLPTPVLLPRLNPVNEHLWDGTTDLELTVEGMEGLRMVIKANTMVLADGSRVSPDNPTTVSLNQVHHDDIPMPMPDGATPPFAWTLQPGGAHFDEPVSIEYPNMSGLAPGALAYFLSFNHGTERFEIVATGAVTADGSTIVTDPDSGLTISGWGCNCPPYSVNGSCGSNECTPPVPIPNGCGGEAMGGGNAFTNCGTNPNPLGGGPLKFCFTPACDDHDICYGTCKEDKTDCDVEFLLAMLDECSSTYPSNGVARTYCQAQAQILFHLVFIFGDPFYEAGQEEACACEGGEESLLASIRQRRLLEVDLDLDLYEDADRDILPDDWERANGLDPLDPTDTWEDPDADGLSNLHECFFSLDPLDEDTDDDGVLDLEYVLTEVSPPLNRAPRLDQTWTVTVNGQTTQAGVFGGFRLENVRSVDVFGAEVGDPADFIGDDLVRVVAHSTAGGTNQYASSPFFRIHQSEHIEVPDLVFSDTPILAPESLQLALDNTLLGVIGETTHARATATYLDSTMAELNSETLGTTFRTSNPAVATVDANGVVTAVGLGHAVITASNEGATSTAGLDVNPDTSTTTVQGVVFDSDHIPTGGATVSLTGLARPPIVTDALGRFTFVDVPAGFGAINLIARWTVGDAVFFASVRGLAPVVDGITEAGELIAAPVPAPPLYLAGGQRHGLSMRLDGSLWAWGTNSDGQLGDGTKTRRLEPVQVGTDTDWALVSAGQNHTLALKDDDTLWVWGDNNYGQLGLGDDLDRNTPTQLGTGTWRHISAGQDHNLAIDDAGKLWAWGYNGFNVVDGSSEFEILSPVQVLPEKTWKSAAASAYHNLAIQADGTLWGWGSNTAAQIDGSRISRDAPTQIGTDNDWAAVYAGGASSFALKEDGTLWGWGANSSAQLGTGDVSPRTEPTQIGSDNIWWFVSSSGSHTVGMQLDGSVWIWGDNRDGAVDDVQQQYAYAPQLVTTETPFVVAVAGQQSFTIAIDENSALWAWGYNDNGQLGNGSTSQDRHSPAPVLTDRRGGTPFAGNTRSLWIDESGDLLVWGTSPIGDPDNLSGDPAIPYLLEPPFKAATVATLQHVLVLDDAGGLYGWGNNFDGELGLGESVSVAYEPTAIVGEGFPTQFALIETGGNFSLAVDATGQLWGWGGNNDGQLGHDTGGANVFTPVAIADMNDVIGVAAGDSFSIVLRSDNTLWAWGAGGNGQLGDETNTTRFTPAQVGTDTDWASVMAGNAHVIARKLDGSVWVWGRNRENQLGDGTRTNRNSPQEFTAIPTEDFVNAGGGWDHTVVVKPDGTLWAWGRNAFGQLGDGSTSNRSAPVQIGTDSDWAYASAGVDHTLALKSDGSLWAWGRNWLGQLGTSRRYQISALALWGDPHQDAGPILPTE